MLLLCMWSLTRVVPKNIISGNNSSDSPTLTLFLYLRNAPNLKPAAWFLSCVVVLVAAVLAVCGARQKRPASAMAPWALALLLLNAGWYGVERLQIGPGQRTQMRAILDLKQRLDSRARLAVLYTPSADPVSLTDMMNSYFWLENPIATYVPAEHPLWFAKTISMRDGKPDFTKMTEEYVINVGGSKLDLPLVRQPEYSNIALYRNDRSGAVGSR